MRFVALLVAVTLCGCEPIPEPPPPTDPVQPSDAELLAQRPYAVTAPPKYVDTQEWPLLILLHGYGGAGAQAGEYTGLAKLASSSKGTFFYVAPNGLRDSQGNRAWHPSSRHWPSWDVEYLLAIIKDVSAKYRIDSKRVYVVGRSQGAHMAHRMACDASETIAAIVSVAGQVTKSAVGCSPKQAVSVAQVHGTADEAIGYYGDVNVPGDPSVPSAHETIAVWARNDRCSGALTPTGQVRDLDLDVPGDETKIEAYEGCPPGIAVELWTTQDGVHTPPVPPDFATILYGFLDAHPRP